MKFCDEVCQLFFLYIKVPLVFDQKMHRKSGIHMPFKKRIVEVALLVAIGGAETAGTGRDSLRGATSTARAR